MLCKSFKLYSYKNLFNHFINLDLNANLPDKILLSGQQGIGKTTFAFHLVNYLLSKNELNKYNVDENVINPNSISFNLVNNLTHPNFFLLSKNKEKKSIEVDQIRNMINFLNKSSFNNNKKIILIDGAENLNLNSSSALLKSLEDTSGNNLFILTNNINKNLIDTIKSRCINFKLNFNYSECPNIINDYFDSDLYTKLNDDFKLSIISPDFLINHINFLNDYKLDYNSTDIKSLIKYVIKNKCYKKSEFIKLNFQSYIEIYFTKMYSKTKDYKYYEFFLKTVNDKNLNDKFNLDLESFFIKFENNYFNF